MSVSHLMSKMLHAARSEGTAVAAVNFYSFESARGALLAARDADRPVILAFGARYLKNLSLTQAAALARCCAEGLNVRWALHLDHCSDLNVVRAAIDTGFDSVMYDGSALQFADNIRNTAQVVSWAAESGADVEAELGAVKTGAHSAEDSGSVELYTDPAQAAEFVRSTGIDALAVSIGTVHGLYKGTPHIRLDILEAIRAAVDTPLVLHGASGTGRGLLQDTIRRGICKINVNTELSMAGAAAAKELLDREPAAHLSSLSLTITEAFRKAAESYMDLAAMKPEKRTSSAQGE